MSPFIQCLPPRGGNPPATEPVGLVEGNPPVSVSVVAVGGNTPVPVGVGMLAMR